MAAVEVPVNQGHYAPMTMIDDDMVHIGVSIIEVRHLAGRGDLNIFNRATSTYCEVKVAGKTRTTKVATHQTGSTAKWGETFHFLLQPTNDISITVLDQSLLNREFIGKLHLPGLVIFSEGPLEGWFPITHRTKPCGEVFLRIHYNPSLFIMD